MVFPKFYFQVPIFPGVLAEVFGENVTPSSQASASNGGHLDGSQPEGWRFGPLTPQERPYFANRSEDRKSHDPYDCRESCVGRILEVFFVPFALGIPSPSMLERTFEHV